jgi:hypothetical protein
MRAGFMTKESQRKRKMENRIWNNGIPCRKIVQKNKLNAETQRAQKRKTFR